MPTPNTVLHSSRRTWRMEGPGRTAQILTTTLQIEQNAFGIWTRLSCAPLPARAMRLPMPGPGRPPRRQL